MIAHQCPACLANLKFDDTLADSPAECPACGNILMLPTIDEDIIEIDRRAEGRDNAATIRRAIEGHRP